MRPLSARPCSLLRVGHIFRACYHELPQFSTTKRTTPTSVATGFPDDFESAPLATDLSEKTKTGLKWDEALATLSEAAIRADQDDVNLNLQHRVKKTQTPSTENKVLNLYKT